MAFTWDHGDTRFTGNLSGQIELRSLSNGAILGMVSGPDMRAFIAARIAEEGKRQRSEISLAHISELLADLYQACKKYHEAADLLLTHCARLDPEFVPSESPAWSSIVYGHDVTRRYEAILRNATEGAPAPARTGTPVPP